MLRLLVLLALLALGRAADAADDLCRPASTSASAEGPTLEIRTHGKTALVTLRVPERIETRAPLNVVLVLDKSGSMGGEEKIGMVKRAARFVINTALAPYDRVSIVLFNASAMTLCSLTSIQDVWGITECLKDLERVEAGGSTNIYHGISTGLKILHGSSSRVSAMMLLSDGQANYDCDNLVDRVKTLLKSVESTISTFAFGEDADAVTLREIATASGGSFYAVANGRDIPIAFADLSGGLTSMAMHDVELRVAPRCDFEHPQAQTRTLKDVRAGEKRDWIFNDVDVSPVCARLTYVNASTSAFVMLMGVMRVEPDDEKIVIRQVLRVKSVRVMDEARALADRGDFERAVELLTVLGIEIGGNDDDPEMKSIRDGVKETLDNMVHRREKWSSEGSHVSMSSSHSYASQRSNARASSRAYATHYTGEMVYAASKEMEALDKQN